jgi:outer membrane receptor protein involved in Fe transport
VISIARDAVVAAGQVDLGEAIRALPQNFGGGQNPGVGTGAGLINSNLNSTSNANLRGLGPDATLTLLNGHRLPADGAFAGVDISAIPLAALDRIEVLPDGASALYGSDAVAGVVNVILRRDYSGIATSAQLGAATDGGYFRQQADMVAGTRWAGGGILAAYDYAHNSAIAARQRAYADGLDPANSLYPATRRHAAFVTAHHDLGGGVTASLDAVYARRTSATTGGTAASRFELRPATRSFTLAPSLEIALGADWTLRALGVYGRDRTRYATTFTATPGVSQLTEGCYCNRASAREAGVEEPLFALAGGSARVAVGAGLRTNGLAFSRVIGGQPDAAFDVDRKNRFAYGELFVPLVSPASHVRGIERLSLSAAVRYEDYPGTEQLATPRIGVVYAPVDGVTLRGTWSRSFKAPSLYQQYVPYEAFLLPAVAFGAGSPGETVFYTSGGNPELKAERAHSWTAGVEVMPAGVPGLRLGATWFDIRYRDRVVQPIAGSIAAAFTDPGFATLIDRSPAASVLAGLVAGAQFGLENFSGAAYDPAAVVALVDNRNINVAAQAIRGVDARAAWEASLTGGSRLTLELAGTWLDSAQQLTSALPEVQLAGTVFNPPKLRVRGAAGIRSARLQASAALNYTGALADRRFATPARIAPGATVDLGVRYTLIKGARDEPGLAISLLVNNLFETSPRRSARPVRATLRTIRPTIRRSAASSRWVLRGAGNGRADCAGARAGGHPARARSASARRTVRGPRSGRDLRTAPAGDRARPRRAGGHRPIGRQSLAEPVRNLARRADDRVRRAPGQSRREWLLPAPDGDAARRERGPARARPRRGVHSRHFRPAQLQRHRRRLDQGGHAALVARRPDDRLPQADRRFDPGLARR